MACDTTHQHFAQRQAFERAARLAQHPHACICDCAMVEAVKRADRRLSAPSAVTPLSPADRWD